MAEYDKFRKKGAAMLRPFLLGLLCMVLCMTVSLGATFAWFCDEVSNRDNVIRIGTLQADLLLCSGENQSVSLCTYPETKVFGQDEIWAPDAVRWRTLTVQNTGNLDFTYDLFLEWKNALLSADDEAIARLFEVYVYEGAVSDPVTMADILAADSGWKKICVTVEYAVNADTTMADILAEHTPLCSGELSGAQQMTYTVALHMKPEAVADELQDKQMNFTISLVANQKVSAANP